MTMDSMTKIKTIPMKFKHRTEEYRGYTFNIKTQDGGMVAGWPVTFVTLEQGNLKLTRRMGMQSWIKTKQNLIDLVELAESIRW